MQRRFLLAGIILTILIAAAHVYIFYGKLPDEMASHFDGSGQANDFMSKPAFAVVYLSLVAGMSIMFMGIVLFAKLLPTSLINLPNKEYWLAPERRDQSFSVMFDSMLWIGIATNLFVIGVHHLVILSNLRQQPLAMLPFNVMFVSYIVFVIGFCIYMTFRFRLPKENSNASSQESPERFGDL